MKFSKDTDGLTAIDYGLIAALIAIGALTIMGSLNSLETAEDPVPVEQTADDEIYGDP